MGDNTKMGRLAGTEELHAKQQEAARKEAERAARMRRGGSPNASRPRAPNDAPPGKRIRNGPTVQFTTQEANTIGAASGVAQNALCGECVELRSIRGGGPAVQSRTHNPARSPD